MMFENIEESSNQVLTQNDILDEISLAVSKVQSCLNLDTSTSRILLQQFEWRMLLLLDTYRPVPDAKVAPKEEAPAECTICCSTDQTLKGLSCGHMACVDCWKSYLTEQLKNGRSLIECFDSNCKFVVGEEKVKELGDSTLVAFYQKLIVKDYIETNPILTLCPRPNCDKVVKQGTSRTVVCSCCTRFCFECLKDSHLPATCQQVRNWEEECTENDPLKIADRKSNKWVKKNTKECPKCKAPIQKNGGCNVMSCNNMQCRHYFCWRCQESGAHAHKCNGKKKKSKFQLQITMVSARFKKCFARFEEHKQKFNAEKDLLNIVNEKLNRMTSFPENFIWIEKAFDILVKCRETVMYSEVYGYYLKARRGRFVKTFKNCCEDLGKATDSLADCLRGDYASVRKFHKEVINKATHARKCLKLLVDHCAKEYDNDEPLYFNSVFILFVVLLVIVIMLSVYLISRIAF